MKILIIDNEIKIRELLKSLIVTISKDAHIIEEANGVTSGLQKINSFNPDIVFLDVEMDDGTGFDLMSKIQNPAFQLIFITAHNKYAIQAFKYSAIDYLLKPIDFNELEISLQKAIDNISTKNLTQQFAVLMHQLTSKDVNNTQIVLKDTSASYFVKVMDILYCEAEGSYTKFYFVNNEVITISKSLSVYDDLLKNNGFIRVHHSFLVNSSKIKIFNKTDGAKLILVSGHIVPISHRKKDYVMQLLENR